MPHDAAAPAVPPVAGLYAVATGERYVEYASGREILRDLAWSLLTSTEEIRCYRCQGRLTVDAHGVLQDTCTCDLWADPPLPAP